MNACLPCGESVQEPRPGSGCCFTSHLTYLPPQLTAWCASSELSGVCWSFPLPPDRLLFVRRPSSSFHQEGFYFSIQFPVFFLFVLSTSNSCQPLPGTSCWLPLMMVPLKQLRVSPFSFGSAFRVPLLCDLVSPRREKGNGLAPFIPISLWK